ncbi:hypothetical protein ACJW31_05G194700 [Castanea mollissima]
MDGSEGLFQDVICTFFPVLTLALTFIVGKTVSEGYWKLSHIVPVAFSCKTRFPESKSWALELGTEFETFADQISFFSPFSTTRSPSSDIVRTPLESLRGSCLLATHTTVHPEMLLYHIPTYRLVEFSGLKNPSLKALPLEII